MHWARLCVQIELGKIATQWGFIVYSIELESKHIHHEYQTEQICKSEPKFLIRGNTNECFSSQVAKDVYTVSNLNFKLWNQPSISDALRLRKVCDSTCFYSVNTFELYKEAKRVGDSLVMERSDLVRGMERSFCGHCCDCCSDPPPGMDLPFRCYNCCRLDSSWLTALFG